MDNTPTKAKAASLSASPSRPSRHQRSISAPKPQSVSQTRRKAANMPSKPVSLLNPDSRPASRSSNDSPASTSSVPKQAAKPMSKRTRQGRRAVTPPNAETDKQSSSEQEEGQAKPSAGATGTSPSKQQTRRSKRQAGLKNGSVQLTLNPLSLAEDPLEGQDTPFNSQDNSMSMSKSAPTSSFLSRRNAKAPPNSSGVSRTAVPDWDMPARNTTSTADALTWQQTLLSGPRAVDDSTLQTRPRPAEKQAQSAQAITFAKQTPPSSARTSANVSNLTWQQSLLGSARSSSASTPVNIMEALENERTRSAPPAGRTSPSKKTNSAKSARRGSKQINQMSDTNSDSLSSAQPKAQPVLERSGSTPEANQVRPGSASPKKIDSQPQRRVFKPEYTSSPSAPAWLDGIKYAGPDFHNSPSASELPVPAFAKRSLVA